MKPIHSTFSAGAKAKLILLKNQPMLLITDANGKEITIYPEPSILRHFGLLKEHTEMLEWFEQESLLHALDRIEQEFVSSHSVFSIISEPLLFEKFKPQRVRGNTKANRSRTV